MTSVLNVDSIAAKDGTSPVALTKQSAAKAWGNIAAGGGSFLESFGCSSLTDYSTGRYGASLTNTMNTSTYSHFVGANMTDPSNAGYFYQQCMFDKNNSSSSLYRMSNGRRQGTAQAFEDLNDIYFGIHGDLA